MNIPLFSIIIPSFNRVNLISETLNSVLDQTFQNWECIIVDDGSTDGTQELITNFLAIDNRFRFIQRNRDPKGASVCRNIGIFESRADFILFLDSDDLLDKNCLEQRLNIALTHPEFDFWVFKTAQFNIIKGDSTTSWNILTKDIDDLQRFILQDMPWHTSGVVWLKKTLTDIGGFDESAICWQDWDLHISALLNKKKYWKSKDEIADSFYRNNQENKANTISSYQNNLQHIFYRIQLFEKTYNNVIAFDDRPEIYDAFAVLYFRIYIEIYTYHRNKKNLSLIYNSFRTKNLFTGNEKFLLKILSYLFKNESVEAIKSKYILKLLCFLNENKFNNKVNNTFQK